MRTIIHACGGCGVNITATELELLKKEQDIYGEVITKYIDTTTADIEEYEYIGESNRHIISSGKLNDSVDGAGGIRESLDKYITEDIKNYVDNLKIDKKDIHIVISSASGGSGSLIGPRLIHNLKLLKLPVIYIMVTDTSSIVYTENSLKTAKHVEIAGNKYGYSIPTIMVDNKDPIDVVNSRVGLQVEQLAILFNDMHKSIDSTDIAMFVSNAYDMDVTGLVTLSIHTSDTISKLTDSLITTLRVLTTDRLFKIDTNILPKLKQYKIGYPNEVVTKTILDSGLTMPLYFAITTNSALTKLDSIKSDLNKKSKIKEEKKSFVDDDEDLGIDI